MASATTPTYKIRQVVELTGASEFLLRTWELRYSALEPKRNKTGRRLYSESDILKARALMTLTRQGHRVGDIAQLGMGELNKLLKPAAKNVNEIDQAPVVQKILDKASAFKWQEVRELINKKNSAQNSIAWVHNLILPLLGAMGGLVESGRLPIAHEHILSAMIKESLALRLSKRPPLKGAPRIVFAAPEGDFHDLGLIIGAFVASELRANTLFLGPHMPKEELAGVCFRYKATHLLLSSTVRPSEGAKDHFLKYLHFLDRNLDPRITIWTAGRNALTYSVTLERKFNTINSMGEFESEIGKCLSGQ